MRETELCLHSGVSADQNMWLSRDGGREMLESQFWGGLVKDNVSMYSWC